METTLQVPFSEKEEAKRVGARWNATGKVWFAPEGADLSWFMKWLPQVHKNKELYVNMVPGKSKVASLRKWLKPDEWKALTQKIYKNAKYKCEICRGRGSVRMVVAHERWAYDDALKMQTLVSIDSLCPKCSCVTSIHKGSNIWLFKKHLMKVNDWPESMADSHIESSLSLWNERSKIGWDIDMTHLLTLGIALSAETRAKIRKGN